MRASWTTPSTSTVTSTATSRKSTSAEPLSRPGPSGSEDTVHGGLEYLAERLTGQCPDEHHESCGHQRHHHPAGHVSALGRSEERRVGKECRSRRAGEGAKKRG